jgi:hypothetical protein
LATLRRDGFCSMDADRGVGELTTRLVRFSGSHLFVNADAAGGQLQVAVLDRNGTELSPFTRDRCRPIRIDSTRARVTWEGASDLACLAGQPVRLRFYLSQASLYSFWVASSISGASNGYVAAGGPGFTGPTDTIGDGETRPLSHRLQSPCKPTEGFPTSNVGQ